MSLAEELLADLEEEDDDELLDAAAEGVLEGSSGGDAGPTKVVAKEEAMDVDDTG